MTFQYTRTTLAVLALCLSSATTLAGDARLGSNLQKFSYALGLRIAENLRGQGLTNVDPEALGLAIGDALSGAQLRLSGEEIQGAVEAYRQEQLQQRLVAAEANEQAGQAFLARNKEQEGVVELEGGLQYKILESGSGEKPVETDTVTVHYRGRLLDGTEFDSSHARGQPLQMQVSQVIPGWQQALQLMPVGAKWEVWVPSGLGYGLRGAGDSIGPNQTLHFEIELISIEASG